jgi:hypothetical protein
MPNGAGKPSTLAQYKEWAREKLGVDFDRADIQPLYRLNTAAAKSTVENCPFWSDLSPILEKLHEEYKQAHGAELFLGNPTPELLIKTYESVVEKSFRMNVLWNRNWPEPSGRARNQWVTDRTLYALMDDLLRGTIVCTYLDGPDLIAEALQSAAKGYGLTVTVRKLSLEEGHYAHHVYFEIPTEVAIPGPAAIEKIPFTFELQITTQPQQLLRHLTHAYYREQRVKPRPDGDWRWNFRSNKFKARYLSHALHLLEAMILEVRDNPDEEPEQKS